MVFPGTVFSSIDADFAGPHSLCEHPAHRVSASPQNYLLPQGSEPACTPSLNSRELTVSHGVKVFDGNFGMNAIARTNHIATQERWNVPQVYVPLPYSFIPMSYYGPRLDRYQVPDSDAPPISNIKVTTEQDDDVPSKAPADRNTGSGDSFGSIM